MLLNMQSKLYDEERRRIAAMSDDEVRAGLNDQRNQNNWGYLSYKHELEDRAYRRGRAERDAARERARKSGGSKPGYYGGRRGDRIDYYSHG